LIIQIKYTYNLRVISAETVFFIFLYVYINIYPTCFFVDNIILFEICRTLEQIPFLNQIFDSSFFYKLKI